LVGVGIGGAQRRTAAAGGALIEGVWWGWGGRIQRADGI
jgi:hypothetical protein